MNTKYNKGYHGNQAETLVKLDGTRFHLQINTSKRSNGSLATTVNAVVVEDNSISMMLFQDYHATFARENVRATTKAVQTQHESVLAKLDDIKALAIAHYNT